MQKWKNSMNTNNKRQRRWLSAATWIFSIIAIIVSVTGGWWILVGAVGMVLLAYKVYCRQVKKAEAYSFEQIVQLSEKEAIKVVIKEEIGYHSSENTKLIAKVAPKRYVIYTVVFALLNLLILRMSYCTKEVILVETIVVLIYEILMLNQNVVHLIYKLAKKNPDAPIANLIAENTYNDFETPRMGKRKIACMLILLASYAGFFMMSTQSTFEYREVEGGYCVENYYPSIFDMDQVVVPEEAEGKKVVAIDKEAFSSNDYLESIELPTGLTAIQGESFKDCSSLQSIVIPEGVTEIRGNTFENCSSLKEVTLHEGIIDIHAYAFYGCSSLEEIDLPSKITEIHANTFEECSSLKSIEIPDGVTRIAAHAFYGCISLAEVYVPDTVEEIGSSAFRKCTSLQEIEGPADAVINERAFKESPTYIEKRY